MSETESGGDLSGAADKVVELVARAESVEAGMTELIDFCARTRPHPDWDKARAIDWRGEANRLAAWVRQLVEHQPIGAETASLFFGLHQPIEEDGEATADLYVVGQAPGGPDSSGEEAWDPEGGHADSHALGEIYQLAYADDEAGLGNDMEYPLTLGYAALAVRQLCRELAVALGGDSGRDVRTGHDSGDILRIGRVTREGLTVAPEWE